MISQHRLACIKQFTARCLALFLIPLYTNFSLATTLSQQPTLEQCISNAKEAINNNKYKDAKKEIKRALKINKDSAEAHLLMALVERDNNDRKEAIKHIYQALQTEANNGEAHYLMAVLLYETNETAQAGAELDKAIGLGIKAFNAYSLKGILELSDKNYQAVIDNYEKALQLNPPNQEQAQLLRSQVKALKNYLEFKDRKDKASYTPPKPLNRPRPNYTEDARRNHVQGIVRLSALIDEAGNIQSTFLYTRLGYGLDEEAIRAVKRMKFLPASKIGISVPYWVTLEVEFQLR